MKGTESNNLYKSMHALGHNPSKYFQGGQNEYVLFSELNKIKYSKKIIFCSETTKHSKSGGSFGFNCILYVIWIVLWILFRCFVSDQFIGTLSK